MNRDRAGNIAIGLLAGIGFVLVVSFVFMVRGIASIDSKKIMNSQDMVLETTYDNKNKVPDEEKDMPKENQDIYDNQSFIGCYQLLDYDYGIPDNDSKLDIEVQLLSDGSAVIGYCLKDNQGVTSNVYQATYVLESILDREINGDYYKELKISYDDSIRDNVIDNLMRTITYNPLNQLVDGSRTIPKSLTLKGEVGDMDLFMVSSNELKYIH